MTIEPHDYRRLDCAWMAGRIAELEMKLAEAKQQIEGLRSIRSGAALPPGFNDGTHLRYPGLEPKP